MSNRIYSKPPKKPFHDLTLIEFAIIVIGCFALLFFMIRTAHADPGYERIQNCLAVNIYWEAASSGEPLSSQYVTAFVVMNRSRAWHMDACDVVFQPGQFSWTKGALNHRKVLRSVYHPPNNNAWKRAQWVAWAVLAGAKDFTGGALFYHADYADPKWAHNKTLVGQWGRHKVYL